MRSTWDPQMRLGACAIQDVVLDLHCRHELVPILKALQYVHARPRVRRGILKLIQQDLVGDKRAGVGCPGMTCWEVVVLAAVRLGCDLDYDALQDMANNHLTVRGVLGLGDWAERRFVRSTLHDNLSALSEETLRAISELIAGEGHRVLRTLPQKVRGDGFVVETNIHYPTDASLIGDGLRTMLRLAAQLSEQAPMRGWRQHRHLLKKGACLQRAIGKASRSRKDRTERMQRLFGELLRHVRGIAGRCLTMVEAVEAQRKTAPQASAPDGLAQELREFTTLTRQVCDVAERRILKGEEVPLKDKLLSLFETHTQLIHRGKSPLPIEFGRQVAVAEDEVGFLLDHRILKPEELEQDLTVPWVADLKKRWGEQIEVASFDRASWTPRNLLELSELVSLACLPKKGKLKGEDWERENSPAFRRARRWHAGIESAIHALVVGNGLDRCRDRGEQRFRRYVALAVLGRNLQTLGRILVKKERRRRGREAFKVPVVEAVAKAA